MRSVILPDLAMVCIHIGCEVIFEGPSKICPLCKWEGVLYRDVEALAEEWAPRPSNANSKTNAAQLGGSKWRQ